jgi:DNA polymerase-3 subunit gamma/tau
VNAAPPRAAAPAIAAPGAAKPASPAARPEAGADDWEQVVERMGLSGATRQLARHCSFAGHSGGVVRLLMDPAHEILATSAQQERLREALASHFGEAVRLQLEFSKPTAETPAERERRAAA